MKLFASLFILSITLFATNLPFLNNYEKALVKAHKEHKLVYVLIVADNCKWCKKFETLTLEDKEIKERVNKEFVTVLLSRDSDKIPKIFKTTPVPRHYFLDSAGNILYSAVGYRDKELMNAFMDNAQLRFKHIQENK